MITDKTKYLADKAIESCSSAKVCYDYAQKLIELTIQECVEAIRSTDLRSITYTTFDKDRIEYCKSQIEKNVVKELKHGNVTSK
jgi:hypothetical protein